MPIYSNANITQKLFGKALEACTFGCVIFRKNEVLVLICPHTRFEPGFPDQTLMTEMYEKDAALPEDLSLFKREVGELCVMKRGAKFSRVRIFEKVKQKIVSVIAIDIGKIFYLQGTFHQGIIASDHL